MRVRAKICGITRVDDAIAAVEQGADAIGLVFYEPSPRFVSIDAAQEICRALPPFVSIVGLFVGAESEYIESVCSSVPLTLLQFHGDESRPDCEKYGLPYIKAVRVRDAFDVSNVEKSHPAALGVLVDSYKAGVPGGTGETFNWDLLPENPSKPLILAGGLNPNNVRNAIAKVRPYAVDVSGGVEQSKGIKSPLLVEQFLKEVSLGS